MVTVADVLVQVLQSRGVAFLFGVPGGGSNLEVVEAAERSGMRFVLTHTENAALFMASAYAELTGNPGVAICTLGPGVANSVNGVAHARLDRVPVILIADRYPEPDVDLHDHQNFDHRAMLSPLIKWSATVVAGGVTRLVQRALREACSYPQGPVHLDLPQSESIKTVGEAVPPPSGGGTARPEGGARVCGADFDAPGEALEHVARLLVAARRPVAVVGLQARAEALTVRNCLRRIAEHLRLPVFTTYKAKGVFDERDQWWAGAFTNATVEAGLVRRADAVLMVGVDPVEFIPRPWMYTDCVLYLGLVPNLWCQFPVRAEAIGCIAGSLKRLAEQVATAKGSDWREDDVISYRCQLMARLRTEGPGLQPYDVVCEARRLAPAGTVAVVDSGAHMFLSTELWTCGEPGKFLVSSGLATMGYAVPAAIGAALLFPGLPVVCFTGDGGLFMQLSELETAARLGARVIVLVFNDGSLSLIRVKQLRKGYDPVGVGFRDTDLAKVSEGLGVPAKRACSVEELRDALEWAFSRTGPALIDARVNGEAYTHIFAAIRG